MDSSFRKLNVKPSRKRPNILESIQDRVASQRNGKRKRKRVRVDAAVPSAGQLDDKMHRSMFRENVTIFGGQFTQAENVVHSPKSNRIDPFERLQQHVAPSAFHNSALRFDPPRCHPDTRVDILRRINHWVIQSKHREEWLLWLNGAAGAGKSAIMQSTVEQCVLAGIAIASFFFFRSDPTRNTIAPLVATLAYQLMQVIPETAADILLIIERNPFIFDQSLESQLQQLLIQPLLRLATPLQQLFVVFVDGLDECIDRHHQSSLINLFGAISLSPDSPVIFVIACRREPQIEAAFVDEQVSNLCRTLPLDNSDVEQTSEDIRHFLTDKLKEIKEKHLRRHLIPSDWPPLPAVEEITSKSSGQFIYSAVVIHYVSSPRANPAHQLDIVRGIRARDASSQNPFAHLDALYQHIFSQVESLEKVLDILAFILITGQNSINAIEETFLLEAGELEIYFADLIAVIDCEPHPQGLVSTMKFLHASLPDFLKDESRSESYHIDISEYRTKLLCMFLQRDPPLLDSQHDLDVALSAEHRRLVAIRALISEATASDLLQRSFIGFNFIFYDVDMLFNSTWVLHSLKQLVFDDEGQAYHHVLDMFSAGFSKSWPSTDDLVKNEVKNKSPDLLDSLNRICRVKKDKVYKQ